MTDIVKRTFFGCCVLAATLAFVPSPLLAQRVWHQGDTWLKWSREARESYVLGYFERAADSGTHGCGENQLPAQEANTSQMAKSITEFYARYPGDRDIFIREVIKQLVKGQTLEQIHNYQFWRRSPSASKQ